MQNSSANVNVVTCLLSALYNSFQGFAKPTCCQISFSSVTEATEVKMQMLKYTSLFSVLVECTLMRFCTSQAQARCHRIGQNKAVKVYRLITRNSYEREMFDRASLKLGLDKAVLQSMSGRDNSLGGGTGGGVSVRNIQKSLELKQESCYFKSKVLFTCDKFPFNVALAAHECLEFYCEKKLHTDCLLVFWHHACSYPY